MAGYGRATGRGGTGGGAGGKRLFASPQPSSGAVSYYVTGAVFVSLCIAGLWVANSSSIAPAQDATENPVVSAVEGAAASAVETSRHVQAVMADPQAELHGTAAEAEVVKTMEKDQVDRPQSERRRQQEEPPEEQEESINSGSSDNDSENSDINGDNGGSGGQEAQEGEQEQLGGNGGEQEDGSSEKDEEGKESAKLDGGEEEILRQHEAEQREHDEQLPSNDSDGESVGGVDERMLESISDERREDGTDGGDIGTESGDIEEKDENGDRRADSDQEEMRQEDQTGGDDDGVKQELEASEVESPNAGGAGDSRTHVLSRYPGDGETRAWATQADQSDRENGRREESDQSDGETDGISEDFEWRLCNVKAGADYIPCLDNEKALKKLRPENYHRYEHRERHCPEETPTCLVPLPPGYRRPTEWPKSRDRIWYNNVPHTKLAEVKGHQNWVKVSGEYLTFPGGGTQFIHGALHYIDFLQQSVRGIAWGKHTRAILDVGCGVASFGGYLFERDVLAMSFAPKDEHEAQVQFALERGIPAISAVMGAHRLPFPSMAFDLVHCARCRVPWHAEGGMLLLELNRVLRPGGLFVWSATPVYQKLQEDVEIWKAMTALTKAMCWELLTIKKDRLNGIGAAFFRKPTTNDCYDDRTEQEPPMCDDDDDPNAAWYIKLKACMHRVPTEVSQRGARWPVEWPRRLRSPPYWLDSSQQGVYGKPFPQDFTADYEKWKRVIAKSYLTGFGISWSRVRNVMDMRAVYGGFAAALRDQKVWVMNVVNIDAPDTLPVIYERGLFGMYHDWCESFSTYPRTYDLVHADHLFSRIRERCALMPVVVEVDRIVRPGGKLIVRDEPEAVAEVERILKSLNWEIRLTFSKAQESILCAEKTDWRPEEPVELP